MVPPKCIMGVFIKHYSFTGASSACDDEGLIESWFEEQMDDEGLVSEDKAKKPW